MTPDECKPGKAMVQGDHTIHRGLPGRVPGYIDWAEHELAWEDYAKRYGSDQSALRIHERGGFGYKELTKHLGGCAPRTWRPRDANG